MLTSHLLSSLAITPLLGAMLVLLARRSSPIATRAIGLVTACLGLALAIPLWSRYDPSGAPYQLLEQITVVRTFGAGYVVGADGLTVVLVLLVALIALAAVVSDWSRRDDPQPSAIAGALILQASIIGVLIALDAVMFVLCWAAMLTTIGILGAPTERAARWRAAILATVSVAAMAAGAVMTYTAAGAATGVRSFDVTKLQQVTLSVEQQTWPFLVLLMAFAAGTWFMGSALQGRGSSRTSLIAVAILALPAYGLVRFNLPILPQAARAFVPLLAGFALLLFVVSAVQAWRGREWTRTVTWIALGQLAVIVLGFAVIDPDALSGSLIHPAGVALALAPLVMRPGLRPATGVAVSRVSVWVLTLAAVGVPGLSGFVGASAIVRGVSHAHPLWAYAAGAGLFAIAVGAVRQVWTASAPAIPDTPGDRLGTGVLLAFGALVLWIGLAPGPLQVRLQPTMARVLTRLDPGYAPAFSHVPGCGSAGPAPAAPAGFTAIAPCDTASSPPK